MRAATDTADPTNIRSAAANAERFLLMIVVARDALNLGPSGPVSPDVDFTKLGRTIELSGGYIRNAVLRAAFVAADQGSSITMKQLWHAVQIECDAAGKLTGRTISSL